MGLSFLLSPIFLPFPKKDFSQERNPLRFFFLEKFPFYKFFLFLIGVVFSLFSSASQATPTHGFSVFHQLTYSKDFTHYRYVNPNAPKGGQMTLSFIGTFDSLNPFIVKGTPPALIANTYATLLDQAHDEPSSAYAYVAKELEILEKKIVFYLNPQAKFNNGSPITAEDVVFSFNILKEKGQPFYKAYYQDVDRVEKLGDHTVCFYLKTNDNKELPLILGQLPILSKTYYETHEFEETSLIPPPASGPYEIDSTKLDQGRTLVLQRVKDWWGAELPTQKGRHNIDVLKIDYYRDMQSSFMAFKAGKVDFRFESISKNWATGYDFPAVHKGLVVKEEIPHTLSSATYGLFFNTRRQELFGDRRVRKALTLVFNFPWINKNIFHSFYKRNLSYFPQSDFASRGMPQDKELAILEAYKDQIPEEVFQPFSLPEAQTQEEMREWIQKAQNLLKEAGWVIVNQTLVNQKSGNPFTFDILISNQMLERIFSDYIQNLKTLGITARLRLVDPIAYQQHLEEKNFDTILELIPQSQILGNEQRSFWGSKAARETNSRNFAGIQDPLIDQLIQRLIGASTYEELTTLARALDRLLLAGYYMIPAWHSPTINVAYWKGYHHPNWKILTSPQGATRYNPVDLSLWWVDPHQSKAVAETKEKLAEKTESRAEKLPSLWKKIKNWVQGFLG